MTLLRVAAVCLLGMLLSKNALADCQLRIATPVNTGAGYIFTVHNDGSTACPAYIGMSAAPGPFTNANNAWIIEMFGFPTIYEAQWIWRAPASISVGPPSSICSDVSYSGQDAYICSTLSLAAGASFDVR